MPGVGKLTGTYTSSLTEKSAISEPLPGTAAAGPPLASDNRKSPRRKRGALSSSSKSHAPISVSQRFKAVFADPVVGPMFHSFLASRPDFHRELRALQLLNEINRFQNLLTVNEKRSSSSSSSSTSSSVNRTARKHFAAIIQQFVAPGAPFEVRFVSSGRDSVKDHLMLMEAKYIEPTVFKPARRAILSMLAEQALEAFYDATAINPPPLVSNQAPPAPEPSAPSPSSLPVPPSTTTAPPPFILKKGSSISRHTSSGTLIANAAQGEASDIKSKRRRSASSGHRHQHQLSQVTSKHAAAAAAAASNTQVDKDSPRSNSGTPTLTSSGTSRTSSTNGSTERIPTKTTHSSRLVMEIHDSYTPSPTQEPATPVGFGNDLPSSSASSATFSTNSSATPSSTGNPSPRSMWKIFGATPSETVSSLNLRYPMAIPPMKTMMTPMTVESLLRKEESESFSAANRIVIVGGDLLAVELAAEIHEKWPKKAVSIVHSHRHLLMSMEENVRLIADNFFKNRRVEVYRKKHVVAIQPFRMNPTATEDVYHLLLDDGSILEADKVVCCNMDYQHGRTAFLQQNFAEHLDGRGFAKVDSFLRFAGTENIFALGDVAALNEYKIAERARAHASLLSANLQRLLHALEMEPYRARPVPKTFDLLLGPTKGVQIENGRFVRIGPGPVERRDFAERRILHRFGALSLVLTKQWSIRRGRGKGQPTPSNAEDETAGSRGETSSDAQPSVRKREPKKIQTRRFSDNAAEEDSDEAKPKRKK